MPSRIWVSRVLCRAYWPTPNCRRKLLQAQSEGMQALITEALPCVEPFRSWETSAYFPRRSTRLLGRLSSGAPVATRKGRVGPALTLGADTRRSTAVAWTQRTPAQKLGPLPPLWWYAASFQHWTTRQAGLIRSQAGVSPLPRIGAGTLAAKTAVRCDFSGRTARITTGCGACRLGLDRGGG